MAGSPLAEGVPPCLPPRSTTQAEPLGLPPASVLHVGDQFLDTGNDYAARVVVPCVWIINEKETVQVMKHILKDALEIPEAEMKEAAVWGSPELKGVAVPQ